MTTQQDTRLPAELVAHLGDSLRSALRTYDARLSEPGDLEDFRYGVYERAREEVLEALDLIDDGTYGACKSCGDAIPVERLEALPHSTSCAGCASRLAGG